MDIEFSDIEKQILTQAMAEAQQATKEHQQVQELVVQKHDNMIGASRAADKVFRAIMILKNINPDAYMLIWNSNTNELTLKLQEG